MAHPSARAERMLRQVYERAARVAAALPPEAVKGRKRIWRTRPALYVLPDWATWERRRTASRAAWAMTIWHRQHPRALRKLLLGEPTEPQPGRPQRVPLLRPVVQSRSKVFGPKMFAQWAPKVITQVLQGVLLKEMPDVPRAPPDKSPTAGGQQPPADEYRLQRLAYHAEVTALYAKREFLLPADTAAALALCGQSSCFRAVLPSLVAAEEPRRLVWGDGSYFAESDRAGAGLFYAQGDGRNKAFRCP
eukprot:gene18094-14812_t